MLAQGAKEGTLQFSGKPETAARTLYAAFQGSVLRAAPGSRWLYAASAIGVCALAPFLLRAAFSGKP
ncbi:hypothetical protein NO135_25470, partial [Clostridioides difficile]|nr:hypothetical protein [Clostridioides difficile]